VIQRSALVNLCAELSYRQNDLVFWKHIDRGLSGDGDIDTLAPHNSVENVSSDIVNFAFDNISGTVGAAVCQHPNNVRSHFFVVNGYYPKLLQIDAYSADVAT
jgi:cyclophilin family peptidyl-prolyl cis-trans isomerase